MARSRSLRSYQRCSGLDRTELTNFRSVRSVWPQIRSGPVPICDLAVWSGIIVDPLTSDARERERALPLASANREREREYGA